MPALATPETSQVLLVDPITLFLDQLEKSLADRVRQRFQFLVDAANILLIPRKPCGFVGGVVRRSVVVPSVRGEGGSSVPLCERSIDMVQ